MIKSEQINELAAALAKAQSEIKGAKADSKNPFYGSNYADLHSVVEALKPVFPKYGLSFSQPTRETAMGTVLETWIMHSSGQFLMGDALVRSTKNDPQGFIAGVTYLRRTGLSSMAGIAEIDDDGNTAAGKEEPPVVTKGGGVPTDSGPSPSQLKRLFAICREHNWTTDNLKTFILKKYQIDSTKLLTKTQYEWITGIIVPQMSPEDALKSLK